jgi:hypothetical protein
MSDQSAQPRSAERTRKQNSVSQQVRTAAWVVSGVSVVIAAFELWVISPSFASFDYVGDPASPASIIFTVLFIYGVWLLAGVIDLVSIFILKGWRNRLIVFAALVVLVVPLVVTFWTLNH